MEYIGNVALDYEYYCGKDLYLDGSEDELLEIVSNYGADEYNRIISEKNSWSILYHLSQIRGNIVEWLPITKEDSVLEIGAGCGAITGVLASKAKKVDCIELSKKRSLVNATRNSEYDNINIIVGNFQDIEKNITEKYDYITLIGVMEYAASYINSKQPYEEFLNIIKKHLAPNGKIIIAIENKYGLKYWAGCREDHVGTFYSGIEGYIDVAGVKTFSKAELNAMFEKCGLNDVEYYYPYPDYKFPLTVYSDDYLPKPGTLDNNLRNFDADRMMVFDESRVYDSLIKDGLYDIFANSFLICVGGN